ncbi:hypothetical protein GCWU000325_01309 [Alloprevotella tannerae ATCC 51259]|uniref:Uncharacterized protein n=2 Tax=Alloprevotella tannerae TaxID=76122 RepID=C9LGG6_9BACT|nr:hypothetical protein GCWU000325_01309 [Alloprevotella tannerae ATCC 51259]
MPTFKVNNGSGGLQHPSLPFSFCLLWLACAFLLLSFAESLTLPVADFVCFLFYHERKPFLSRAHTLFIVSANLCCRDKKG